MGMSNCTAELLFNLLKRQNQREYGLKLFLMEKTTDILGSNVDESIEELEDDLYASSDDENEEKTSTVPGIAGLDVDEDTKLAIALSASQMDEQKANDNDKEEKKELIAISEDKEETETTTEPEKKIDDGEEEKDDIKQQVDEGDGGRE